MPRVSVPRAWRIRAEVHLQKFNVKVITGKLCRVSPLHALCKRFRRTLLWPRRRDYLGRGFPGSRARTVFFFCLFVSVFVCFCSDLWMDCLVFGTSFLWMRMGFCVCPVNSFYFVAHVQILCFFIHFFYQAYEWIALF